MAWRRYYIVVEVPEEALRDEDTWSDVTGSILDVMESVRKAGGRFGMRLAVVAEPMIQPVEPGDELVGPIDDDEELEIELAGEGVEGDGRDA